MSKNTRKNRSMGSIDGPADVSYRLFVRDFIEDIEFSRPFAVTLTMNSVQWRSHSQNFRHFMNRLNQSFLKSGYRRYGKRLTVVPIIEGTRRAGDCTQLVSGSTKAESELGWTPVRSNLKAMIGDAWRWHQTGHYSK